MSFLYFYIFVFGLWLAPRQAILRQDNIAKRKPKAFPRFFAALKQAVLWALVLGSLIFGFSEALATSYNSTNFKILDPVISQGGSKTSSANFTEQATISGPVAIGVSSGTKYIVKSGFQYFDETPPYTKFAMVNDGLVEDIDEQTSLDTASANWSGLYDPESGLHKLRAFELKFKRESDGFAWDPINLIWFGDASFYTTSTKITLPGVDLQVSEIYYFELRARNNLNMVSPWLKSDGFKIIPYLSFTIDSPSVSLGELSPANNYTNEALTSLLVSTNAYRGYKITTRSTTPLTHNIFSDRQIPDWLGTNANPTVWNKECPNDPNFCGFGYRTSDANLSDGNPQRFIDPLYFAGFNHTANETIADHTEFVTGKTGEIKNEKTEIKYRISATGNEVPGDYTTTIIYIISANY